MTKYPDILIYLSLCTSIFIILCFAIHVLRVYLTLIMKVQVSIFLLAISFVLVSLVLSRADEAVPKKVELRWMNSVISMLKRKLNICLSCGGQVQSIHMQFRKKRQILPTDKTDHALEIEVEIAKQTMAFYKEENVKCYQSLSGQVFKPDGRTVKTSPGVTQPTKAENTATTIKGTLKYNAIITSIMVML